MSNLGASIEAAAAARDPTLRASVGVQPCASREGLIS